MEKESTIAAGALYTVQGVDALPQLDIVDMPIWVHESLPLRGASSGSARPRRDLLTGAMASLATKEWAKNRNANTTQERAWAPCTEACR